MSSFKPFNAYIVKACRTAGGKKGGALSGWQPADLGAVVCDALVERTGIDASQIDDVIFGCVSQIGSQAGNIGRNVVLASKRLPESVPGCSVDRQCGSSQQSLHFAAQAVMSGSQDVVIAGGVEVMSLVPIGSNIVAGLKAGTGIPMTESMISKYGERMQREFEEFSINPALFSQFGGAELLAKKYGMTRQELEEFSCLSQERAALATREGRFKEEIVPIPAKRMKGEATGMHEVDEGIRATSMESLGKLKALNPNGVITAGVASQICDGAAAVLIVNDRGLEKLKLKPIAKFVGFEVVGHDPVIMLEGPVPAAKKVLERTGMTIDQIGLYEVNEAFAPVPLACVKAVGMKMDRLNVNGGAMALGHPLGGTGAKLMTTLVHEMERSKTQYGMLAICEGGGTANALIVERCGAPVSKL